MDDVKDQRHKQLSVLHHLFCAQKQFLSKCPDIHVELCTDTQWGLGAQTWVLCLATLLPSPATGAPVSAPPLPPQKLSRVKQRVYTLSSLSWAYTDHTHICGGRCLRHCFTHTEKPDTGFCILLFTHSTRHTSINQMKLYQWAIFNGHIIFHYREVLNSFSHFHPDEHVFIPYF